MAIFNRTYSPLRTQLSMLVAEGSLTQDYDADNKVYTPDRRIRPTAIQPICSITDPAGILDNGVVNSYITDIKWYENEISEANLISPNDAKYKIDSMSNTGNRGRIIIMKNVHFDAPVTLIFTATFADMVNGKIRRKAYFVGRSVLASNVAASSPLVLKTDYPRGRCFNPIVGLDHLKLSADLVAGNESIPSAYWWYKKNGVNETLITGYVGHNTRELEVPTAQIGKEQHYVCKAQDCRSNLTQLRNDHLQAELDKMAEYPRNLLAKQYLLDLNDEIKLGVVTEGEDADGKYICIPSPLHLYDYVGGTATRDLFFDKIKFKENTVYTFRCTGKYVYAEDGAKAGFRFLIVYTDGTKMQINIGGFKEKKELVFSTASGKTVSRISASYGHAIPSYIYDIQVTEEYNYNLLQGTEEVSVEKDDVGTDSDKYKATTKVLSKTLAVGSILTLKVDDFVNVVGNPTHYTFGIYQSEFVSGTFSLKTTNPIANFTINNKYDATKPATLIMYAGPAGATTGNKVRFKNVQLVEGKFARNVLGKDIPEVTVADSSVSDNSKYARFKIKGQLAIGGKYTITVGDVVSLAGTATEYTTSIYQFDGPNTAVSNAGKLSKGAKSLTFTITEKYNPAFPAYLLLYAGTIGSTAGNSVRFENVRLLQGETILPSMPAYSPHFIPAAPDVEVEAGRIELPDGYRPSAQGKTIDHEFTLVTRLPPYKLSVVTPYGDDSGVISIPSDVKLFPAWIKADMSGIGTLDHPEKYFSADWGNGLKGMNVLLDADDIGLGVQEVSPDVVEGMRHAKYGLMGYASGDVTNLEEFTPGARFVVEYNPSPLTVSRPMSIRQNRNGIYITSSTNKVILIHVVINNVGYRLNKQFEVTAPLLIDIRYGSTPADSSAIVNGVTYQFRSIAAGLGLESLNALYIQRELIFSLIEIYQGDKLLHKWDFKGATNAERLSDKAETENKIKLGMGGGSAFVPV